MLRSYAVEVALAKLRIDILEGKDLELKKKLLELESRAYTIDKIVQADFLSDLADTYKDMRDFRTARRLFLESLKRSQNEDQIFKNALFGLAQTQDQLGEYNDALESYKTLYTLALQHTDGSLVEKASNAIARL